MKNNSKKGAGAPERNLLRSFKFGYPPRVVSSCGRGLTVLFLLAMATVLYADDGPNTFAARAQTNFNQARLQFQADTNNPVVAWEFGRACYDLADWATNKAERAAIARAGIAACRRSLLFTNCAAGHYYLAMDLGQLAQAETLHGLRLVREMEHEFSAAANLDAQFDFAGPERGLGLLYRDAPGWPLSIGSRQKAHQFLGQAVTLASEYPENVLNLGESQLEWGKRDDARKELENLDALWPKARTSLIGPPWEQSWDDWSKRRETLRGELADP